MEFIKLYALKIYTAEDVQCGDEPFYKAVLQEARRLLLGGGTVIRAAEGYGTEVRGDGRAVPIFSAERIICLYWWRLWTLKKSWRNCTHFWRNTVGAIFWLRSLP